MANQAIYAPFRVLDANGDPVAGALAAFYVSGTTTPIDVFSDAAGLVPASNPVEADGDGYLPQRYFDGAAKVVITDALGATLRTIDPCPISIISGAAAGQTTFDPTAEIPVSNVQDAIVAVDENARTREESLQPLDATLTSLAGLPVVQGDLLHGAATAGTLALLAKGTAGQLLRMNAGETAPEWWTPPFTKSYTSAEQTVTSAGLLTLAHGLGAAPAFIQLFIKITGTVTGFTTGDVVSINPGFTGDAAGNRGTSVVSNATNILVRFGSSTAAFSLMRHDTGDFTNATNTEIKLIVKAWA